MAVVGIRNQNQKTEPETRGRWTVDSGQMPDWISWSSSIPYLGSGAALFPENRVYGGHVNKKIILVVRINPIIPQFGG